MRQRIAIGSNPLAWNLGYDDCIATAMLMSMKTSTLPPVRVDEEFRAAAESVLHEGESLTSFIEATVRRAVEHRFIQAAFETRARESLEHYKLTGISSSIGEVFDRLEAKVQERRKQVLGN